MPRFCIITPAHNEEAFIERTINSLVQQTIRPSKWIIVNDSSTDSTGARVQQYADAHEFIDLITIERPPGRHFGNKVNAFCRGLEALEPASYDYIGNLDADISVPSYYFERLLQRFENDPKLGLAGGAVSSRIGDAFIRQAVALDSVAGAVQFFRRECFEDIGGYLPLPLGGVDAAAEIMARRRGWLVRTFDDLEVFEYRRTGSSTAGPLAARFKEGRRLHALGYSPLFFLVRCLNRALESPRLLGSMVAFAGFSRSALFREPIILSPDAVRFLRAEQRRKLLGLLDGSYWRASRHVGRESRSSAVENIN